MATTTEPAPHAGDYGKVNRRTHRKVLICDEQVGFTGGVGIADVWLGDARDETEWRDTHVRVVGPATDGLRAAFVGNCAELRLVAEPVHLRVEEVPLGLRPLFRALLRLADHRVRITIAYVDPDDHLCDLLCETSRRGVLIEALLPGPHIDERFLRLLGRSQCARLTAAGPRQWEGQSLLERLRTALVLPIRHRV